MSTTIEPAAREAQTADSGELCCPVKMTLKLLEQKWTLHIIRELMNGKLRFNELAAALGGVNPRTLTQRLKSLEYNKIVKRRTISSVPPWVEYELTDKGRAFADVIESIINWGTKWYHEDCS